MASTLATGEGGPTCASRRYTRTRHVSTCSEQARSAHSHSICCSARRPRAHAQLCSVSPGTLRAHTEDGPDTHRWRNLPAEACAPDEAAAYLRQQQQQVSHGQRPTQRLEPAAHLVACAVAKDGCRDTRSAQEQLEAALPVNQGLLARSRPPAAAAGSPPPLDHGSSRVSRRRKEKRGPGETALRPLASGPHRPKIQLWPLTKSATNLTKTKQVGTEAVLPRGLKSMIRALKKCIL